MPSLDGFELVANLANGALREHVALALDVRIVGRRRLLKRVLSGLGGIDDAATHERRGSEGGVVKLLARLAPTLRQRLGQRFAGCCPLQQKVTFACRAGFHSGLPQLLLQIEHARVSP
eukprot:7110288-Prymnesium_polylepis.1